MNFTFVTRGKFEEFLAHDVERLRQPDVLVLSEGIVEACDLLQEAEGTSSRFLQLADLSEQLSCVLICGMDTSVCDIVHRSAAVFDCGRLMGVSDMTYTSEDTPYTPGAGVRVYETSAGRIGIVVGEDLYVPDILHTLTLCESDVVVSLFGKIRTPIPQLMLRASAFCNGVNICMSAKGYVQIADICGELVCALDASMLEYHLELARDYRPVHTRKRGF